MKPVALLLCVLFLGGYFNSEARIFAQQITEPYTILDKNKKKASRKKSSGKLLTTVSFEILTPAQSASLAGQKWYQEFEKLRVPLRIHQGLPGDTASVTETVNGRTRRVTVVAVLGRRGELLLPGRKFTTGNTDKLQTWIEELKLYGAQGNPAGQELWGLTDEQFLALFKLLEKEFEGSVLDKNFLTGLEEFEFPKEHPLLIQPETKKYLTTSPLPTTPQPQELTGLSRGAALVIFLRQYGLGFTPKRLPDKRIVLSVELLDEMKEPWPVGWDWGDLPGKVAPVFHSSNKENPVRRSEHTVEKFAKLITDRSGMRILFDDTALKALGFEVSEQKVKVRPRITTWNLLLTKGLSSVHLQFERRLDEKGEPFLWVIPTSYLKRHPINATEGETSSKKE